MIPKKITAIAVGSILYASLNWIIVLGPIIAGFASGWILKDKKIKNGFNTGVTSALLGFLIIIGFMDVTGIEITSFTDALVFWMFIAWNLLGFILCGIGGALASMFVEPIILFKELRKPKREETGDEEITGETYVICPACGYSNLEQDEYCRSCKTNIME